MTKTNSKVSAVNIVTFVCIACLFASLAAYYYFGTKASRKEVSSLPSVTLKSPSAKIGNGWVHVSSGRDGSYLVGFPANFESSEVPAVVCAQMYGPMNTMSCKGSCTWYSVMRPGLVAKKDRKSDAEVYLASPQATQDAAELLLSSHGSVPSDLFFFRGDFKDNTLMDNNPVDQEQFQIDCVLVRGS